MIAAPFFLLGLFIALFATHGSVIESFGVGAMTAAITFAAAFLLCMVDSSRARADLEKVRRMLLERSDQSFDEFMTPFPLSDRELVERIRTRLAQFFGVSESKLRSDDYLDSLSFDRFMPGIYLAVMSGFDQRAHLPSEIVSFPTRKLTTFSDLIEEGKALRKKD